MGEIPSLQILFYNLGNNRSPEIILSLIPLFIDPFKLLKTIGVNRRCIDRMAFFQESGGDIFPALLP
jgi:hypothetical protein